jgi:CRP/FNR family transcriptional regulator, dissimilatory nitrate respiration regulator
VSPSVDDILSRCQLFGQLHPSRRQQLATIARLCQFDKGQLVFRQGDPCPGVYIVGSGLVRVFKIAPSGKEHVLHIVGPGQSFAEVAVIAAFDCVAHAEAIAPSTCVLLPADLFRQQMADDHQLCLEMMTGLALWVRHVITLLEDIVLRDATGRIARFLLAAEPGADGTVRLPSLKRHVASHLNLTSETFSRTFSRLIEAGLIVELDNNRVRLVDRERLHAISEGAFPCV